MFSCHQRKYTILQIKIADFALKKDVQFTATEDLLLLTEGVGQNTYTVDKCGPTSWSLLFLPVKHYKSNNRAQLKK